MTEDRSKVLSDGKSEITDLLKNKTFRTIMETTDDLVSITKEDGIPIWTNRMWLINLGYSMNDLLDWANLVHPDDRDALFKRWQDFTNGDEDFSSVNFRLKNRDEAYHFLESNATRLSHPDGDLFYVITRDVTEQKKMEGSLVDQAILLSTVLNSIPDVIGIQDPDHRIIQYNKAGYEMLGMSKKEAQGQKCYELIGKKNPCNICATSQSYVSKKPSRVERFEPSLAMWLDVRAYPVLNEDNELKFVIEHLRDITKEKMNQEKLKDSEEMFRSLVEASPDWIWEIDIFGKYSYSSPKVHDILGYFPSEVMGKKPTHFMSKSDKVDLSGYMEKLLTIPQSFYGLENVNIHKNGNEVILETSGVPIFDNKGDFKGYRGIDRDITERKKAEKELKYRLGFENVLASISADFISIPLIDIDKCINGALEKIGGLARADRSYIFLYSENGKRMDNTHEWCNEGIEPSIDQLQNLDSNEFFTVKEMLRTRKESIIISLDELPHDAQRDREEFEREGIKSLVFVPIIHGDRDLGFIGFDSVRNERKWEKDTVTLLKIVGEIIVSALMRKGSQDDLMLERNRAELYLDLLGHDIGNIHQGINTSLQIVQMTPNDEKRNNFAMSSAQELTNRSIKLVRTVLLLSKLRSKEPEFVPVNVCNVLEQSRSTIEKVFTNRHVDLMINCPDDCPEITAEPLISELFFNLVHNAIKFQSSQNAKVEIDVLQDQGYVVIIVTDHGPGITDDMKSQMFQRFNAGGPSSQTGLGLSLVKTLVERYNGKITVGDRVEGDHSQGARFTVFFPIVENGK